MASDCSPATSGSAAARSAGGHSPRSSAVQQALIEKSCCTKTLGNRLNFVTRRCKTKQQNGRHLVFAEPAGDSAWHQQQELPHTRVETSAALTRRRTGRGVRRGWLVHQSEAVLLTPSTLPAGDAMDYAGRGDNFGETPMSSVRCSMRVLNSVHDCFFARGVSRVRASCTVPRLRVRFVGFA